MAPRKNPKPKAPRKSRAKFNRDSVLKIMAEVGEVAPAPAERPKRPYKKRQPKTRVVEQMVGGLSPEEKELLDSLTQERTTSDSKPNSDSSTVVVDSKVSLAKTLLPTCHIDATFEHSDEDKKMFEARKRIIAIMEEYADDDSMVIDLSAAKYRFHATWGTWFKNIWMWIKMFPIPHFDKNKTPTDAWPL